MTKQTLRSFKCVYTVQGDLDDINFLKCDDNNKTKRQLLFFQIVKLDFECYHLYLHFKSEGSF